MPRKIEYDIKVVKKGQDAYAAVLVGPREVLEFIPLRKRVAVAESGWKALKRLSDTFKNMGFME